MSKRFLIGVYTRGLHNSIAFKFAEYLAASQCIVAVNHPKTSCRSPWSPAATSLPFQNPDQCVHAQLPALLDDPELVRTMRQSNHHYYASEVQPAALAARVCGLSQNPS